MSDFVRGAAAPHPHAFIRPLLKAGKYDFRYPTTLTAVHLLVCALLFLSKHIPDGYHLSNTLPLRGEQAVVHEIALLYFFDLSD